MKEEGALYADVWRVPEDSGWSKREEEGSGNVGRQKGRTWDQPCAFSAEERSVAPWVILGYLR